MPLNNEKRKQLIALGSRIRELRRAKGFSQKQMADAMGKDRQSLHRIETGQINPGCLFLLEVCEALEIELQDLVKGLPYNRV